MDHDRFFFIGGLMIEVIVSTLIGWLTNRVADKSVAEADRILTGDAQAKTLRNVVHDAIEEITRDSSVADGEVLRSALLVESPALEPLAPRNTYLTCRSSCGGRSSRAWKRLLVGRGADDEDLGAAVARDRQAAAVRRGVYGVRGLAHREHFDDLVGVRVDDRDLAGDVAELMWLPQLRS
jgi:hypothetical protein